MRERIPKDLQRVINSTAAQLSRSHYVAKQASLTEFARMQMSRGMPKFQIAQGIAQQVDDQRRIETFAQIRAQTAAEPQKEGAHDNHTH